jgi:hypothetical protein
MLQNITQIPIALQFVKDSIVNVGQIVFRIIPIISRSISSIYQGVDVKKSIDNYNIIYYKDLSLVDKKINNNVIKKIIKKKRFRVIRSCLKTLESLSFLTSAAAAFTYTLVKVKVVAMSIIKLISVFKTMIIGLSVGYIVSLLRGVVRVIRALCYLANIDSDKNPLAYEIARRKLMAGLLMIGSALLGGAMVAGFWFGAPLWLTAILAISAFVLDFYLNGYDLSRKGLLRTEKKGIFAGTIEHYKISTIEFIENTKAFFQKSYTWMSGKFSKKDQKIKQKMVEMTQINKKLSIKKRNRIIKSIKNNSSFKRFTTFKSKEEKEKLVFNIIEQYMKTTV